MNRNLKIHRQNHLISTATSVDILMQLVAYVLFIRFMLLVSQRNLFSAYWGRLEIRPTTTYRYTQKLFNTHNHITHR